MWLPRDPTQWFCFVLLAAMAVFALKRVAAKLLARLLSSRDGLAVSIKVVSVAKVKNLDLHIRTARHDVHIQATEMSLNRVKLLQTISRLCVGLVRDTSLKIPLRVCGLVVVLNPRRNHFKEKEVEEEGIISSPLSKARKAKYGGYYHSFYSRALVFVASLFRVDVDEVSLQVSEADTKWDVHATKICIASQQSKPSVSVSSLRVKASHCEDETGEPRVLCENTIEAAEVSASNLEVTESAIKYRVVDINVNSIDSAYTSDYQMLVSLLLQKGSNQGHGDGGMKVEAALEYAPNTVNVSVSNLCVHALSENESKNPCFRLAANGLTGTFTNRCFSSFKDFRYTWQMLTQVESLAAQVEQNQSEIVKISFEDVKSITTSTKTSKLVQNVIVNVGSVKTRFRPVELQTIKLIERALESSMIIEGESRKVARPQGNFLGCQLAINSIGLHFESRERKEILIMNLPTVSVTLEKKLEGLLANVDCSALSLFLAQEPKKLPKSKLNAVRSRDLFELGKLRFSLELTERDATSSTAHTELDISRSKFYLNAQYFILADVLNEYACPWITAFRGKKFDKGPSSITSNIHVQASNIELHYAPDSGGDGKTLSLGLSRTERSNGIVCEVELLSLSSMHGGISNVHMKKLALWEECNFENARNNTREPPYLVCAQDITMAVSSSKVEDRVQLVSKIWCSRFKIQSNYDSLLFLVGFYERANKDFDCLCKLSILEHFTNTQDASELSKPIFNIQTHRLDLVFVQGNTEFEVSARRLGIVRVETDDIKCSSISFSAQNKDMLRLRGVQLNLRSVVQAENNLEISVAIKHACGIVPDKIKVGDSFHELGIVFAEIESKIRDVIQRPKRIEGKTSVSSELVYTLSLSLLELDLEVENSEFEVWLVSHKSLLQECHFGTHLLQETSEANVSVFEYLSPSKEKDTSNDTNNDTKNLYNQFIKSYIRECKKADSRRKIFKHAFRLNGKRMEAKMRCVVQERDLTKSLEELDSRSAIVSGNMLYLVDRLNLKFGEVSGNVCSMIDPFAHIKGVQVSLSKPSNANQLKEILKSEYATSEGMGGSSESSLGIYGDIYLQIDSLKGLYGVAMEPYFAYVSKALQRLSPTQNIQNKGKFLDLVQKSYFGTFHFGISSLNAILAAETKIPEDIKNENHFQVSLDDFRVELSRSSVKVSCKNFGVNSTYNLHRGSALASSVEHEQIPIFKAPICEFCISIIWRSQDTVKPAPNGIIEVCIKFKEDDTSECPTIYAGERQVKCLAHLICLLKDPPGALRDSFERKLYGAASASPTPKFVKKLDKLTFEIVSDPLKIRFWDPIPDAPEYIAELHAKKYRLGMEFIYTDIRLKVVNAKCRRVPKLKELHITGEDVNFTAKNDWVEDDELGGDFSSTSSKRSSVDEKIATLLGKSAGQESRFEEKEFLVLHIDSINVSNVKSGRNLLQKTPFRVQIDQAKGLLNTLKRDVLYTCIQVVASGINDVLNEHRGEDMLFELANSGNIKMVSEKQKEKIISQHSANSQQDLLSLLLQKDQRHAVISVEDSDDDSESIPMNLNFVIEVLHPQLNLESESANGRFLLSADKALVKGYKAFTEQGMCIQEKSEISLESIQMHICQTDIDPNAKVQWLEADIGTNKLISPNEHLLHSIFDPCSVALNLFQRGEYFEIDIDLSSITLSLDSREFEITSDVISRIALSPFPTISEKISLSLFGSDMLKITRLDRFASDSQLEAITSLNQKAFEDLTGMMYAVAISKRSEQDICQDPGIICPDALHLKEQLKERMKKALREKKDIVVKVLEEERKAKSLSSANHKQTKVSLKVNEIKWSLCKDRSVFAEATLHKLNFARIRYEDFSGITRFQIGDIACIARISEDQNQNDVIRLWDPSDKPFVHMYMIAKGESQGLSTFELCDISLHPLEINMSQKTASEIHRYFFQRSLSPEERRSVREMWSVREKEDPQVEVEENAAGSSTPTPTPTPKLTHRHSRSWDVSSVPILDFLSEVGEEEEDSLLGILNSVGDKKLSRQESMEKERGIALERVRFNELVLSLSFKSAVLNVTDMKVYLDTFNYFHYKGTWSDMMDKVKWNIIKSVLKNFAGGFINPARAIKGPTPRKKSIFRSLFRNEADEGDESTDEKEQAKKILLLGKYNKTPQK